MTQGMAEAGVHGKREEREGGGGDGKAGSRDTGNRKERMFGRQKKRG